MYEHGLADGDEAVIEWTMLWRDPRHGGEQRLDRGTEWFRIEDGLIAEVRERDGAGEDATDRVRE